MSLLLNIDQLINEGIVENERIEFKKGWNPEPIMHTICAFSNDIENQGGGYVIVGIEEENGAPGDIVGIERSSIDKLNGELLNICNLIIPRVLVYTDYYDYQGKCVYVIQAPGGHNRPYKCPISLSEKKGEKSYYIRKMGRTIRANQSEEKELFELGGTIPFDDRLCYSATESDLSLGLMREYIGRTGSKLVDSKYAESMMAENLHVIGGPKEDRHPINVGLMFFNYHPEDFFREAYINVIYKPDPTGHGMEEHIFRGPLDKQLNDALGIISNKYISEYVTKVPDRAEAIREFNYPMEAVEEALCNAVYHKAYDIAEPITVTITPNYMEIVSVPGPDRSIKDEDLERGVLISKRGRNRRIGFFLKELKLAESHNTGVPLMKRAMMRNGSEPPMFKTDEDRSYMSVVLPVNGHFRKEEVPDEMIPAPEKSNNNIVTITAAVLKLLQENGDMSVREISDEMGYKSPPSSLRNVLKALMDAGYIQYMYPDSPRAPNQRIMLK